MNYPDVVGLVLVFLVLVIVAAVAWAAGAAHGETVGEERQKIAEALAYRASSPKPGDLFSCRDPQAVAEAIRRNGTGLGTVFFDEKGHAYRLPMNPRDEIALALLLRIGTDWNDHETTVWRCFRFADEFIKQAECAKGPEAEP